MVNDDTTGEEMLLITYSSSALSATNKVRFYYALKGRDKGSGITKLYSIEHLGKQVFLVSAKHRDDMDKFFQTWKMPYTIRDIMLKKTHEVSRR